MCCVIVYIEGFHVTRPRPHFTKSFCAVQEKMEEKYFIFSHKNSLFFSFKVFKVKKNPCFSKVSLSFSLLKPCKMSLKFCEFQMNFFKTFLYQNKGKRRDNVVAQYGSTHTRLLRQLSRVRICIKSQDKVS